MCAFSIMIIVGERGRPREVSRTRRLSTLILDPLNRKAKTVLEAALVRIRLAWRFLFH